MVDPEAFPIVTPTGKMTPVEMRQRTKRLAVRIIHLTSALPRNRACDVVGRQLLKAGTSIGANYHEAQHASTRRQFISMVEIAQREASETIYWLELLGESNLMPAPRLAALTKECQEILAILTAIIRSGKSRRRIEV